MMLAAMFKMINANSAYDYRLGRQIENLIGLVSNGQRRPRRLACRRALDGYTSLSFLVGRWILIKQTHRHRERMHHDDSSPLLLSRVTCDA